MKSFPKAVAGSAEIEQLDARAYSSLKDDIIRCKLEPERRVTENELAERLGMSKAPIRAALTRLCHEGLMISERRKGYVVAPFSITDVREVFGLRQLIEPEVARLAAGRITDEQIRHLKALCNIEYIPEDRDSEAIFLAVNRQFHVGIAEATGNRRLIRLTASLLEESERSLHIGLQTAAHGPQFQHEHLELLNVLVMGDGDKAAAMVREQIRGGMQAVINGMLQLDGAERGVVKT